MDFYCSCTSFKMKFLIEASFAKSKHIFLLIKEIILKHFDYKSNVLVFSPAASVIRYLFVLLLNILLVLCHIYLSLLLFVRADVSQCSFTVCSISILTR